MRMQEEARALGTVDTTGLLAYLEARHSQEAGLWHFQCDGIPALDSCDRIILRHSRDYNFDFSDIVDWPLRADFQPYTDPITAQICQYLGKPNIAALFIANLPAGGMIYPHVDRGEFLEKTSRIHVPLKTNPQVLYRIGGAYVDNDDPDRMARQVFAKEFHMAVGEIWEIDNMSYHSVINQGTTERWHLIANVW